MGLFSYFSSKPEEKKREEKEDIDDGYQVLRIPLSQKETVGGEVERMVGEMRKELEGGHEKATTNLDRWVLCEL
jgi:hypothetical protein